MGAVSFWEEFRRANPTIVTDLEILKGKAVTTFNLDRTVTLPQIAQRAERTAEKAVNTEEVDKGKKAAGFLALAAFFSLLLSAVASSLGALLAYRRPTGAAPSEAQPDRWAKAS